MLVKKCNRKKYAPSPLIRFKAPAASTIIGLALSLSWFSCLALFATAQEPQWIWAQDQEQGNIPIGRCFFRKAFRMTQPESGQISIWCDDKYTLYVNGMRVSEGMSWQKPDQHDVTKHLIQGRNVVAVAVQNSEGNTAGLAARLIVKEKENTHVALSTNKTWKASVKVLPLWPMPAYSDRRWKVAQEFGQLGKTQPWLTSKQPPDSATPKTSQVGTKSPPAPKSTTQQPTVKTANSSISTSHGRFKISQAFSITELFNHQQTGSVIALTFDEFGRMIFAREQGGLFLAEDSDGDGQLDKISNLTDQVKNCQGILAVNGQYYVVGDGPNGSALYRWQGSHQRPIPNLETMVKFRSESHEHGPHGLTLGPDGKIYVSLGNLTAMDMDTDPAGPYQNYYEGLLASPKYEDPGGHATDVKAPGGTIIRVDIKTQKVETVAGGLRNAYDLAFDRYGELFTHDSDMESDQGTPWHRGTRLLHVIEGAEFGWRSGWSKWPDYFVDSTPPVADTGRGSPAGLVFYNHFAFPTSYHNALFSCDWSSGRIMVYRLEQNGTSWDVDSEVFLEGQPLNVTDIEVGPDGAVYFTTGGRNTNGGIYRVSWNGTVPEDRQDLGKDVSSVIRQPQFNSAWSRQAITLKQQEIKTGWADQLTHVAKSKKNPPSYRIRALQTMRLYGPLPSLPLLLELSSDSHPQVRASAAYFMGVGKRDSFVPQLKEMLKDDHVHVRRHACEALLRIQPDLELADIKHNLQSTDRMESWAARRLLERIPADQWRDQVLSTDHHRLFIQGALALMIAYPSHQHGLAITQRITSLIPTYMNDRDFTDILRVQQLAILRAHLSPEEAKPLAHLLAIEFPAGESKMNREVVRLLAYLQVSSCMDRYVQFLHSDADELEKLHLAIHLRYLESGWTSPAKINVLKYFDQAMKSPGGKHFNNYLQNISLDFGNLLTPSERKDVLLGGENWPNACFVALYAMGEKSLPSAMSTIRQLDADVAEWSGPASDRLKIAIVATLASEGSEASFEYLRQMYEKDANRRVHIAMALAEQPSEKNWSYLVQSIPLLDGPIALDIIRRLQDTDRASAEPEEIRQVILQGLKQDTKGKKEVIRLLQHWTGEMLNTGNRSPDEEIQRWQQWFSDKYSDHAVAELPKSQDGNQWQVDELLTTLDSSDGLSGSPHRGAHVYSKAQCAKCHKYGDLGETLGPDLSTVSRRFHKKEIVESILHPSHVVSDQYASKTVFTYDGKIYTGIVSSAAAGELVITKSNGGQAVIPKDVVEKIVQSQVSVMPDGLLDSLTLQEVVDLFTFLNVPARSSVSTRRTQPPR